MNRKSKILTIIVIINILIGITMSLFCNEINAVSQKISQDVENIDSNKYPGIKEKIEELKKKHPNWNFKILYTGLEWDDVIENEYKGHGSSPRNLVPKSSSYEGEWLCPICGDKAYDSGNWRCASEKAIEYMMDPRNSLNEADLFQFLELSYGQGTVYKKEIVKQMLKGSFLEEDKYIDCIMSACQAYGVSPYYVVARIIQEQGKTGSTLTKGEGYNGNYVGYYNVFNIGASGSTKEKVILNGLAKAQKYGWTSLELSIKGGIEILVQKYIAIGQNTLYFQKFDVENSDGNLYWHQYMQNILAAQNEGTTLRKTYESIGAMEDGFTFVIPVYENMPKTEVSRPNSEKTEYELVRINVTSTLRMRNSPNGTTTVGYLYAGEIAKRLEKATEKVNGTYWDKILKDDGTIGYVARCTYDSESTYKLYLVPVEDESSSDGGNNNTDSGSNSEDNDNNNSDDKDKGDLEINSDSMKLDSNSNIIFVIPGSTVEELIGASGVELMIKKANGEKASESENLGTGYIVDDKYRISVLGDISGDGKISASDYGYIKNHIMQKYSIDGDEYKKAADINKDGKISASDYGYVKNYIMGKGSISF